MTNSARSRRRRGWQRQLACLQRKFVEIAILSKSKKEPHTDADTDPDRDTHTHTYSQKKCSHQTTKQICDRIRPNKNNIAAIRICANHAFMPPTLDPRVRLASPNPAKRRITFALIWGTSKIGVPRLYPKKGTTVSEIPIMTAHLAILLSPASLQLQAPSKDYMVTSLKYGRPDYKAAPLI